MKDKGLIFVVGILLWQIASGLEMCKGPFKPPSIDDVTADPIFEPGKKDVLAGADIMLKMTSSVPLTASWGSLVSQTRTEENPGFKTSTEVNGDSYIFRAEDRIPGHPVPGSLARYANYTYITVTAAYPGCNSVRYHFDVTNLLEMARGSLAMPTTEEMPAQRYTVDEAESAHDMTTRLSFSGAGSEALNARLHCGNLFYRVDDRLIAQYILSPVHSLTYNPMEITAGIAEGRCIVKGMTYSTKSKIFGHQAEVRLSPSVLVKILVTTEIRKPSISKPAIRVETEPFGNTVWNRRLPMIPATENTTRFTCLTDAETVRNVTMVESVGGEEKKRLTPRFSLTDLLVPSIRYYIYDIESPPENWIQDYECTVVDGDGRQNSMKFQVGATPIRVTADPKTIYFSKLNDSTVTPLRIRFNAIGSPEVNLKVYVGIQPFMYPINVHRFQEWFDLHRQIKNTPDHRVYTKRIGAKMQGVLVVPDVRKLVPRYYWRARQDNFVYSVVFLAYNSRDGEVRPLLNIVR